MRLFSLGILLATTLAAGPAQALMISVNLTSGQAVPAPVVDGFSPMGSAIVDVNTVTGAISITGSYIGMTSNVNNSHLHGLAGPGVAIGVIFGLSNTAGTSGTFSGSDTLSPANLAGLLAGLTYINIHTVNNGSGEIRGQVVAAEPATLLLLGLGCAGLATTRRRAYSGGRNVSR